MPPVEQDQPKTSQPFSAISEDDLKALQARMAKLSEVLGELPGRLGLAA